MRITRPGMWAQAAEKAAANGRCLRAVRSERFRSKYAHRGWGPAFIRSRTALALSAVKHFELFKKPPERRLNNYIDSKTITSIFCKFPTTFGSTALTRMVEHPHACPCMREKANCFRILQIRKGNKNFNNILLHSL